MKNYNDNLKWVELATSKDETRYNLTSVYRDTVALVATDGHRLHLSNGLTEAKPGYLSGLDATFPDYSYVMPTGTPSTVITLTKTKGLLRDLKALAKLIKPYGKDYVVVLTATRLFENNKPERKTVTIARHQDDLAFSLRLNLADWQGEVIQLGVNLAYLIDALLMPGDNIMINIYGREKAIEIINGLGQKAIVMPIRLS